MNPRSGLLNEAEKSLLPPPASLPSLPPSLIQSFMPSAARGGGEREANEEYAKSDESTPTLCPGLQIHCARRTARAQYRTSIHPSIHPFIPCGNRSNRMATKREGSQPCLSLSSCA